MGQRFNLKRRDIRLRQTKREYPLWGHVPPGGNRGGEGDFWDSLTADSALEWARGLYYALTGGEEDGVIAAPASGHKHDEGWDTVMTWLAPCEARPSTAIPSTTPGFRRVDETSETLIAFFGFLLPSGATHVLPRARLSIPSLGTIKAKVRFRFYTPAGVGASAAVDGGYLSTFDDTTTAAPTNTWFKGGPFDLSGITTTDGYRIVFCRIDAAVSNDYFDLEEFQIALPPRGYRALPAKVDVDTAIALPDRTLPRADLHTLYVTNPERLRQLVFGATYALPRHSRPHDHGEGRGETLSRAILSVVYGPHALEGGGATTGGTAGLPLAEAASGVDYATTPKLIAQHAIWIPGGIDEVKLRPLVDLTGGGVTRTVTLKIEIRPLQDGGYTSPGGNQGVSATATIQLTGSLAIGQTSVTLDVSSLGNIAQDRLFECCVWLAANPASGSTWRLLSLLAYPGTAPDSLPELATHAPREELPVAKIREGQVVSTLLQARAHRTQNQATYEALGGAPGLEVDLTTTKTTDPWRRLLTEPHQHRGTYTDAAGNVVHDGAVVRLPLLCHHYAALVNGDNDADGVEDTTGRAVPTLGIKCHYQGRVNTTGWVSFGGRVSIPKGLGAIDLYALIQPATAEHLTRLWVFVGLFPFGTDNKASTDRLVTTASSGPFSASRSEGLVQNLLPCQVLPQEGAIWQPNAARLASGLGVWTRDALRDSLPSGTSGTNAGRWTEPLRVEIAPTDTYDCFLDVRFGLQVGSQTKILALDTYDTGARCLALLAVPSRGY